MPGPSCSPPRFAIAQHSAEGVEMEFADKGINAVAGDLTVNIFPSDATKFKAGKDKQRYEHLNIGFLSGIPRRAKGIFAELSGVQAMSEATTALLRQPKGAVALMQRARQGVCPPGCVPRVPKEKYLYFGGSNGECTYQDKDGRANVFAEDNAQKLKGQPRDQYALPTGDAEVVLQAVSGTDVGLLYSKPINFGTTDATKAKAHKRAQIIWCAHAHSPGTCSHAAPCARCVLIWVLPLLPCACRSNADPDCLGYGSDTHAIDRWFLVSLSNRGEGPWTEKECQRPEPDGSSGTYTDTCTFDEAKAQLDVGLHTFPALDCESEIVIPIQGAGATTDTSRRKQLDRESNNCGDEDTETGCWVKFVEKEVLDPNDAAKPPTKVIEKYVFDPTREIEYEDGPSLSELLRQARAHKAEIEKKASRLSEQKEKVYYVPE